MIKKMMSISIRLVIVCSMLLLMLTASFALAQPNEVHGKIKQLLGNVKSKTAKSDAQVKIPAELPRYAVGKDGYVIHLGAPPSHYFPVTDVVPGNPSETARNFLKEHRQIIGAVSPRVDFRLSKSEQRDERHYESLKQTYEGIPVFSASIMVQLNSIGGVEYMLSDIARDMASLDDGSLSIEPAVTAREAEKIAKDFFSAKHKAEKIMTTTPELNIYDPSIIGNTGRLRLIWLLEVHSDEVRDLHKKALIDAHSGEIVAEITLKYSALFRVIYDQANTNTFPGTLVRSDSHNPPGNQVTGIAEVDNAYVFLGDSYNFYKNNHNRDARDGAGGTLMASVRAPFFNAYGGLHMQFGDGWASADDIVAHEYTHYITSIESTLNYINQSGAINESFSDIWGEFIDLSNNGGTDTTAVRWLMGEDIVHVQMAEYPEDGFDNGNNLPEHGTSCWNGVDDDNDGLIDEGCIEVGAQCGNGLDDDGDGMIDDGCPGSCHDSIDNDGDGAVDNGDTDCFLRDMKNPQRMSFWLQNPTTFERLLEFRDPDRMSNLLTTNDLTVEDFSYPGDGDGICEDSEICRILDSGGVHINSGIGNKLAYLLTDGDTFNMYTITGMGIVTTAKLFYEVQTGTLKNTPGADYTDLYHALKQAAINIGWTSQQRDNLVRACHAVEIADAGNSIYVDGAYTGIEQGTQLNPFNTVVEGKNAAATGDSLFIKGGSYNESIIFDRFLKVNSWNGPVVIGR